MNSEGYKRRALPIPYHIFLPNHQRHIHSRSRFVKFSPALKGLKKTLTREVGLPYGKKGVTVSITLHALSYSLQNI